MKLNQAVILMTVLVYSANLFGQSAEKKGKNPIIIIPGIMGSKLVNSKTGEVAWVRLTEAKSDDLSLPVSPNLAANKDDLIATDIVDRIRISRFLPGIGVYSELIGYLEKKVGYRRGNWDMPLSDDDRDTYYVFAYDWRQDNVESARLLIEKIESLKVKLKKPELKFDVLAHSMGGLIARYAAMYGTTDLSESPKPNWAGARHFERIFMFGTPNEGSMGALETLNEGYTIDTVAGRIRPDYLSRKVAFTIPSIYQLLPHGKSAKFYGEDLQPLDLDIYNPSTWRKYGWVITADIEYSAKLGKSKRAEKERFFEVVLRRARLFHQALDVKTVVPKSLAIYLFGSDCKRTLNGAIVRFDRDESRWKTSTDGDSFRRVNGEKVDGKLVRNAIFGKGDGTVALSSLLGENVASWNGQDLFFETSDSKNRVIVCEEHTAIIGNRKIQETFSSFLTSSLLN